MGALDAGSIDLVVTSPPYNLAIRYLSYADDQSREDYLAWSRQWLAGLRRVLAPAGSFFLNVGASPRSPLLPHQLALVASEFFTLQNTIHWIKSIAVDRPGQETFSVGHYKPINSPRFLNELQEYVFHFTLEGNVPLDRLALGVPYQDKSNIARWQHTRKKDRRCRGNVWFLPYQTIRSRQKERPHPATFPPELARQAILLHGRDRVRHMLDPFVGIGSSALAARAEGIEQFTGFEIDEGYLEVAKERLSELL